MGSLIKIEPRYSPRSLKLINSVIQHVLEFLTFTQVKRCRLVCRQWHSKADYLMRKKGLIVFSRYFRPSNYIEDFSQTNDLPPQTFAAFQFGSGCFQYTVYELHEFFMKFGKNIKCLRIDSIKVSFNKNELSEKLNIDPFIELLGSNVEELAVFGAEDPFDYYNKTTFLEISLHKMSNVENILLKNCGVIIDNYETRISPSKITLEKITFSQNRKILHSVIVTDYINFQKCSFISIHAHSGLNIAFDLLKDVVVAKEVSFQNNIRVLNWVTSKMKTTKLLLQNSPTHANGIHSEILEIRESTVSLANISNELKKLSFYQCAIIPCYKQQVSLPNLKRVSLLYSYKSKFKLESVSETMALTVPQFKHCPNLTFMEIGGFGDGSNVDFFDVGWLPKSLIILRLNISHRFTFVGRADPIEIDYLILGGNYCIKTTAVERVLERIKPKKLILGSVAIFHSSNKPYEKKRDNVIEFLAFIQKQKPMTEIIVKVDTKDFSLNDRLVFSKYVDQLDSSDISCYKFIDSKGTTVTSAQFEKFMHILGSDFDSKY